MNISDLKQQNSLKEEVTKLVNKHGTKQLTKLMDDFVTDFLFVNVENADLAIEAWNELIDL